MSGLASGSAQRSTTALQSAEPLPECPIGLQGAETLLLARATAGPCAS